MIQLPDFEKSFFYENNFYLSSDVNRMAKVMAHYELYKMSLDIPGAIVECGVFKGASFVRFGTFRELLSNPTAKKMIGFDIFGEFPNTDFALDQALREKFIHDSGEQGIGKDQLYEVMKHKKIDRNVELIQGNVNETIPAYLEANPHLRISLLNIDVDVYEATKTCIEYLFPHVVKGGVVILDDYANVFPGANKAVEDFLEGKGQEIKRFPFAVTPCYFIKK